MKTSCPRTLSQIFTFRFSLLNLTISHSLSFTPACSQIALASGMLAFPDSILKVSAIGMLLIAVFRSNATGVEARSNDYKINICAGSKGNFRHYLIFY